MLFEDETGFCPWHKKDSSFQVVHHLPYASPTYYNPLGTRNVFDAPTDRAFTSLLILECLHCRKSVILLEKHIRPPDTDDGPAEEQVWRVMVSPSESPKSLHASAPEAVRSLFAEASTCETARAFRAAGVMYRATVEELVKDQQAIGSNLYAKIDSLNGTLPTELVEDLHEARMLGNDSIHAGITYSAEEVADIAGLIEEAVLVLYVQPEEKRAMRDARKARRQGSTPA